MADVGNLREDLILTKHDDSQNGHLEHGPEREHIHCSEQELEVFSGVASRQYHSGDQHQSDIVFGNSFANSRSGQIHKFSSPPGTIC